MSDPPQPLPLRRVFKLFWPLAGSWMLMGVELPLFTAVVARMEDPKIHLAAFSSIVFPISLIVEAPIIMLLAAATALTTDRFAYRRLFVFMTSAGAILTALHIAIAFTPLFGLLARDLIRVPEDVLGPARTGLMIMTPWTWSIAYRRMHQGVLIRFEQSRAVALGTLVRLITNVSVLLGGFALDHFSGIVVGCSAIACGVVTEAVYVRWRVRLFVERLEPVAEGKELRWRSFYRFYVPLALTPLLTLLLPSIGAAAMAQMPSAMLSLAAWSGVHGLVFLLRSVGMAYNEVVVALIGEPGSLPTMRRFNAILMCTTMGTLAAIGFTPLATLWFEQASGLEPELAEVARVAVALSILMPGYAVLQSYYQGVLVHQKNTRPIPEAVAVYLITSIAMLSVGVALERYVGVHFAVVSFSLGGILQTLWLWIRSRSALDSLTPVRSGAVAAAPQMQ